MAIKLVKNRINDAIFTAMDNVTAARVEMAVGLITSSSKLGPNSTVQNRDRRDFILITENTPLKSASSQLDLDNDQNRINDTLDIENSEDGDFSALGTNYDQQAHIHHSCCF